MAFPDWMGPNIEARHVEVMGWGTEPAPPIGAPPVRELPPGEESRYPPSIRHVVLLSSGRQLVVYCPLYRLGMFDSAMQPGEQIAARDILVGDDHLWIGGDDVARRCRLLVDGRKAVG